MKAKELREMSKEDLKKKREDIRSEIFNLRFRTGSTQNPNPNRICSLRRDIARVETIIRESKNNPQAEAAQI